MKEFFQNLIDRFKFKKPKVAIMVEMPMDAVVGIVNRYEDIDTNENIQIDLLVDGKFQLSVLAKVLKISRYKPFFTEKDLENPIIKK